MQISAPSNIQVDLTPRQKISRQVSWAASAFNVVAALLLSSLILFLVGVNPIAAFSAALSSILTPFGTTEVLTRATPLLLVGLAVYLPLKAGLWNIAGGAQIYAGGIVAVLVGSKITAPAIVIIPTMIIVGAIAGAFIGLIPGYLRAKYDVNEIIVTLLLTFAFVSINEYAIQAIPNPDGIIHGSAAISSAAEFPQLAGRLHIGIFLALIAAVLIHLLVTRTKYGHEIKFFGDNEASALRVGISKYKVVLGCFIIGGALGGIAGVGEIGGLHHRLLPDFSAGFGFTAIAIALLGRSGVPYIILASLLFGVLFVAGSTLESVFAVPFAIVDVMEALVILFLVTAEFFRQYEVDVDIEFESNSAPSVEAD
jgi:simple sugar transport system permease protein